MSEENKKVELKEEDSEKVVGGNISCDSTSKKNTEASGTEEKGNY